MSRESTADATPREHGRKSFLSRLRLPMRTVVSLTIAVVATIVFLEIAEEVREGEASAFDHFMSHTIHALDSDAMDRAMKVFTFLGSVKMLIASSLVVAAVLFRQHARRLVYLLTATVATSIILNNVLKGYFQRARPDLFFEIVAPLSYSFPSGHALMSTAIYGAIAIVLARFVPRLRSLIFAGAAALVLLIGMSRIYLGVHWATDVLAGFVAGGFLLAAFEYVASRVREPQAVRGEHA